MVNWQKWLAGALVINLVACTTFAAGFGVGRFVTPGYQRVSNTATDDQQKQFGLFWEAWNLIQDEFYTEKPLDSKEMTYGAIRGMVESLGDAHSMFLTPQQKAMFNEDLQGEFGGIGVTIRMTAEGQLMAVKILPNSPAETSGLQGGDLILEVDGKPIQGMDTAQAISLIRGPKGTQVLLRIQRGQPPSFEVTLTRAMVSVPTVESRMLENGIAYLSLSEFNARATAEVRSALDQLLKSKPLGLIFDLRGNPGGYLHVAAEIASEFLADGLVVIERSSDGQETRHQAQRGGRATQIPLVVLVDQGSASASEIVAGAIQDRERGMLIGEQTFGKGSVQITEQLSDGSGLQITIRRWHTPNDHQIDGKGLTPDIKVELTEDDLKAQRDPQLAKAVEYLLSQTKP